MLTAEQIKNRSKTVTRRLGWWFLNSGDIVNACEQCQGLKKGEKIVKMCQIRIIDTREEPLHFVDQEECVKEGFPQLTPAEFVRMFCRKMKCPRWEIVNRIEFEYL